MKGIFSRLGISILCLLPAAAPGAAVRSSAAAVAVVQGTASVPAADRRYAQNAARRISRWLGASGIRHELITDEAVIAGALNKASVALLCYNPNPPPSELLRLRDFLRRGGKLIVLHCEDGRLANLMGMRLGSYAAAQAPGQWAAFRFTQAAPPHVPEQVCQEARGIWPVYPASPNARVIACWENDKGAARADAACVQSDAGYWISYPLLDGDTARKRDMLTALIGSCLPGVWQQAADRFVRFSGVLGSFRSFEDAVAGIRNRADAVGAGPQVEPLLAEAGRQLAALRRFDGARQYPEAVQAGRALRSQLTEAYGRAQAPRPGEIRGVWNHSGTGLYPGDWNKTCAFASAAGMTAIFPNMVRGGTAYYRSRILPPSEAFRMYGDQLAPCVEAAHANGLRVHAWVICWSVDGAPPDWIAGFRKQNRLQVTDAGKTLNWLCPSDPANRELQLDVIAELAANYSVDGIHLDYIRYTGPDSCFCSGCRKRFEQESGQRVRRWPANVRSGKLAASYRQWRCAQISRMVDLARRRLREARPSLILSAAVYGGYPECTATVGQDWASWLARATVDFVCPMDYTSDLNEFRKLLRGHSAAAPGAEGRVFPGIGVTAAESSLDAPQVIDQVVALRAEGMRGFVLFDLNRTLEREILPVLSLGISRAP